MDRMETLRDVNELAVASERLFSATHEEILAGRTADVYFVKTRDVLRESGDLDAPVVAEIFSREDGIFAGSPEVFHLLRDAGVTVWSVPEGRPFGAREVLMRLEGAYGAFGLFETTILGMLAASTGWATAARRCVDAAAPKPVLCFGARHVHPAVAPVMERAALVAGGCTGASCILGAKLAGREPQGTIPHAAILLVGETLRVAQIYDRILPEGEPRLVLVDTFRDEAEEALAVARVLRDRLAGIRLDTPGERGGVTPALVGEIRARLDQEAFQAVRIVVSGGLSPDRMPALSQAGADAFGVGSYIAHATPRDMTMDIKEVRGRAVAKRGRIPGKQENPHLVQVL